MPVPATQSHGALSHMMQGQLRGQAQPATQSEDAKLMEAARELEANFLAEMLKYSGLGEVNGLTGGGPGEEQFASLLRQEQARAMVDGGGIGLAQSLFEALKERADGTL